MAARGRPAKRPQLRQGGDDNDDGYVSGDPDRSPPPHLVPERHQLALPRRPITHRGYLFIWGKDEANNEVFGNALNIGVLERRGPYCSYAFRLRNEDGPQIQAICVLAAFKSMKMPGLQLNSSRYSEHVNDY